MVEKTKSLESLFITAIQATVREDRLRRTDTLLLLKFENHTFIDRVFANFLIIASAYYKKQEIESWLKYEGFIDED